MKTIFFIVVLTVVYIYAMIQLEALRMANPNINPLASTPISIISSTYSSISSYSSSINKTTSSLFISSTSNNNITSQITTSYNSTPEIIPKIKIYIYGSINKPGEYELEEDGCLEELIELAGGLSENADSECFDLYYSFSESSSIYIAPKRNEEKISINNDYISELDKIPGVGEVYANRILQYRYQNGDFQRLEDIKNVLGIGEVMYEKIKDLIKL